MQFTSDRLSTVPDDGILSCPVSLLFGSAWILLSVHLFQPHDQRLFAFIRNRSTAQPHQQSPAFAHSSMQSCGWRVGSLWNRLPTKSVHNLLLGPWSRPRAWSMVSIQVGTDRLDYIISNGADAWLAWGRRDTIKLVQWYEERLKEIESKRKK